MRDYEIIYVVRPDLTDQDIGTIRSEVKNRIESSNGSVEKENLWGKRQLAFEVKDFTEGVYTFVEAKMPPEAPGKLTEQFKIDERVIRHIITVNERKQKTE